MSARFDARPSRPATVLVLVAVPAVGFALVAFPGVVPFVAIAIALDFVLAPWLIERAVPARIVPHDGEQYLDVAGSRDGRIARIVARRCRDAGVPPVKLGIVDDAAPNAFTFGRGPKSARLWVSRGLINRLDDGELDAVVCHELGHVKRRDVLVMSLAAVVPVLFLWIADAALRGDGDDDREPFVGFAAYIAYFVSTYLILALSRAREYGADRWSCERTGDGDALASALVKVAYGIASIREKETRSNDASQKSSRSQAHTTVRALAIMDPDVKAPLPVGVRPQDVDAATSAMQWEVANPWAAFLEKSSSHPLVSRRIRALARSGLPGAPRHWHLDRDRSSDRVALRTRFARELACAYAPWAAVAALLVTAAAFDSVPVAGILLVGAGVMFALKQQQKYPSNFVPAQIVPMLSRLDASPVAGIPVELRGRLTSCGPTGISTRGEMVLRDATGSMMLRYRAPLPFAWSLFARARFKRFVGRDCVVTGWYHREPGPIVDVLRIAAGEEAPLRTRSSTLCWASSLALAVCGVIAVIGSMLSPN